MSGEAGMSLRQTCPECGRTSRPHATECRKCGHPFAPKPVSSEVAAVLERESRERTERRLSRRSKLGIQDDEVPAVPLAAIATSGSSGPADVVSEPDAVLQVVAAERKARRASIRQVRLELVEDVVVAAAAAPPSKTADRAAGDADGPFAAAVDDKAAARRKAHRDETDAYDRAEAAKVGAHIERAADDLLLFLTPKAPAKRLDDGVGTTLPKGSCLRCKRDKNWPECTAFEPGPVRKAQCVTCLHAVTDHEQVGGDGDASEKLQRKAEEAKRKAAELETRRKAEEAEASQQRKERRAAEAEAQRRADEEAAAAIEAQRKADEAQRKERRAAEVEAQRRADEEAAAEALAANRRLAEAKQKEADSEAAKQRKAEEDAKRKEALRKQRDDAERAEAAAAAEAAKQRKDEAAKQREAEVAEAAKRRKEEADAKNQRADVAAVAAPKVATTKVVVAAAAAAASHAQPDAADGGADGNATFNKTAKSAIAAAQDNEPTFTALQLNNNTVYAMKHRDYSEQLGRALVANTHLREVTLVKCDLDHFDATLIAAALRTNTTLRVLNLAQNKITNEGATAIADALRVNCTLMELNLLGQGHAFGEPCLQSFIDMFSYNVTLTKIIWRLDSRKSFAINKLIVRNNTIKKWVLESKDVQAMYPTSANVPIADIAAVLRRNGATITDDDDHESDATDAGDESASTKSAAAPALVSPRGAPAAVSPRGAPAPALVSPRGAPVPVSPRTALVAPSGANAAVKKMYETLAALQERWQSVEASGVKSVAGAEGEAVCGELSKMRARLEELSGKHATEMAGAVAQWRAMNKDIPARINDARQQHNKAAAARGGAGACAKCATTLSGNTLEFGGRSFHAKCFVCTSCATPLSTSKAIAIAGAGYCEDCGRVAFSKSKFVEMTLAAGKPGK